MALLHTSPHLSRERGSALVWAVGVLSATVALMFSDGDLMRSSARERAAEFARSGQADAVAQAGLNDALAWLRRQRTQPVLAFTPQRNLTAVPPVNETDDAALGLVREYEISPGLWGRYEVRTGRPADPFVDANLNGWRDAGESFTDLTRPGPAPSGGEFVAGRSGDGYGDGKWTPALGTRDISFERGAPSRGTVWHLESRGMVFRRERADLPLGRDPNVLLGSATAASEATRLVMTTPATAAICAPSAGFVTLRDRVRVRATGGLAVAVGSSSGLMTISGGAQVLASTQSAVIPGYSAGVKRVFGVDWPELKTMADWNTQRVAGMPDTIYDGTLVVLEGNFTYGSDLPLVGSGVLAVKGNLSIDVDSKSYFTGVIYVEGNVTIDAPALIRGTIIATGTVLLRGTSGDYVEVESDPAAVVRILGAMSQYRFGRAVFTPDRESVAVPEEAPPDLWAAEPTPTPEPTGGNGNGHAYGHYRVPPAYGNQDEDRWRVR